MKSSTLLMFLFFPALFYAQDTLFTRSGMVIGNVVRVTEETIEFTRKGTDHPIYSVRKKSMISIHYKNGEIDQFVLPVKDTVNENARKNVFKFGLLAVLDEHISVGFERVIRSGFNLEISLGVLNTQMFPLNGRIYREFESGYYYYNVNREKLKRQGGTIRIGSKFPVGNSLKTSPRQGGYKDISGLYFMPEFHYSLFKVFDIKAEVDTGYNYPPQWAVTNVYQHALTFTVSYGYQLVILNRFTVSGHLGIGYGQAWHRFTKADFLEVTRLPYDFYMEGYYGSHVQYRSGFATTAALRIGWLF